VGAFYYYSQNGEKTMKQLIGLILVIGLAAMIGCAQEQPEAAAKKIFEQQVAGHEGLELDTSGLVYTIADQSDDHATVEVSGDMAVKASIPLARKGGAWVLAMPSAEKDTEDAAVH
jgi:hypothetical protein